MPALMSMTCLMMSSGWILNTQMAKGELLQADNAAFDEHDMPYNVVWLDIEHTDGKR